MRLIPSPRSSPGGVLYFNSAEMVWPSLSITGGVAIAPMHRFNPKINCGAGSWQKDSLHMEIGQQRDFFYKDKSSWYYLGIYECVSVGTLSPELMKDFDPIVRQHPDFFIFFGLISVVRWKIPFTSVRFSSTT